MLRVIRNAVALAKMLHPSIELAEARINFLKKIKKLQ
jgi:hypothetical protein